MTDGKIGRLRRCAGASPGRELGFRHGRSSAALCDMTIALCVPASRSRRRLLRLWLVLSALWITWWGVVAWNHWQALSGGEERARASTVDVIANRSGFLQGLNPAAARCRRTEAWGGFSVVAPIPGCSLQRCRPHRRYRGVRCSAWRTDHRDRPRVGHRGLSETIRLTGGPKPHLRRIAATADVSTTLTITC